MRDAPFIGREIEMDRLKGLLNKRTSLQKISFLKAEEK